MIFESGKGDKRNKEWKWNEEGIEEVKEMKYLGFMMEKNGGTEKHILERLRRATIAMKQTWSKIIKKKII